MAAFVYSARDRSGVLRNGVLEAKDLPEARLSLRSKDLFVTDIRERAAEAKRSSFSRRKVKLGDLVVMARQLATLVKAGVSIIECLQSVAQQSENPFLAESLEAVRLDVMTGSTLHVAMKKHPTVFNERFVSLVQTGEAGGVLDKTLDIAADQLDSEAELREKVKAAFVYPILVLIASVLVVAFMLVFIVPVFANVYQQFHAQLPPVTQALVALSNVVVHYWYMVLAAIIAIIYAFKRWHKTATGRAMVDKFLLKMPLLGKLNRKITVARFTQSFSGCVSAGVPLLEALLISARTASNVVITEAISQVALAVKEGAPLAESLEKTQQFPAMVTRMIAAGEQSGNLDEMLSEITHFYHRDIEYTVNKLTRLMEPLMTVVVGGIVLFVLLALYMPVFNLTHVLRK